jgi:chemotaxis protein MotB
MAFLGAIGACVAGSGCTSPEQYRKALDEKDAQIRALHEERAELKRERDAQMSELDSMSIQLQEANARISQPPEPSESLADQPGLEELGIGYGMRNGMAVITIPSSITFPSGKAELSSEGKNALKQVASVLKDAHPSGVYSIEGHTDTDPIRKSSFDSNRELSLARAMAVLTFLVEECRIPDEQCVLVGHGQYRPVDGGSGDASKAKNRRVEIVVHAAAP